MLSIKDKLILQANKSNVDFSQCFNFGMKPALSQPGCSHLCVLLCRLQVEEEEETKEGMEELHTELGRCAGRGREVRPGKRAAAVSWGGKL